MSAIRFSCEESPTVCMHASLKGSVLLAGPRALRTFNRKLGFLPASSLVVLAESVAVRCVVAFTRVPNILWMRLSVRVVLDREVGIASQEVPIERAALAVSDIVVPFNVLAVEHGSGRDVLGLVNHGSKRLQVGPVVPAVRASQLRIGHVLSEEEACDQSRTNRVPSEVSAGGSAWVDFREVVDVAMLLNNRDSSGRSLETAADHGSNRPEEEGADAHVDEVGILVLALNSPLVLPWNAFWISSELTEAIGDPWVRLEVLLQPVDVFVLLLLRRHRWHRGHEDFIGLSAQLPHLLVALVIKRRLSIPGMVSVIVLARHGVKGRVVVCR